MKDVLHVGTHRPNNFFCGEPEIRSRHYGMLKYILDGTSSWYHEPGTRCEECKEILYRAYPEVVLLELRNATL
jgi:hypothetical protein